MIVYMLHVAGGEYDSDGADFNEWFPSLEAAQLRRAALIAEQPAEDYKFGEDYAIERVELAKLPPKALLLAALNGKHFVADRVEVVPAYVPPPPPVED